ncbi:MAG: DUF2851 family protein [Planctomycetes bacterium]|nr:DUF2851 family protein [Planctomycetota bacterium]
MIQESDLQKIWLMGIFNKESLITENGSKLDIIFEGILNRGQGPDFRYAKIYLDDRLKIGDIELHLHAESWYEHVHHLNVKYENVILHVCLYRGDDDANIIKTHTHKNEIPVLILQPYLYEGIHQTAQIVKMFFADNRNVLECYGCKWLKQRIQHFTILFKRYRVAQVLSDGIVESIGYPSNKFVINYLTNQHKRKLLVRKGSNLPSIQNRLDSINGSSILNQDALNSFVNKLEDRRLVKMNCVRMERMLLDDLAAIITMGLKKEKFRIILYNVLCPSMIAYFINTRRFEEAGMIKLLYQKCRALLPNRRTRAVLSSNVNFIGVSENPSNLLSYFGLIYLSKNIENI